MSLILVKAPRMTVQYSLTVMGPMPWTTGFMLPERAFGSTDRVREPADGCEPNAIWYAALTGRLAFKADTAFHLNFQTIVNERLGIAPRIDRRPLRSWMKSFT